MMRGRRAVILFSVMVVVAIGAAVGATSMYLAEGERDAARLSLDRTAVRALAWSGVQGALAELAEQRDSLLQGGAPELTGEWTLYTDEGDERGVIRLLAIGNDGAVAVSELAKVDINTATEEMLAGVPGVGEELAALIVKERAQRPFESVEDLGRLAGVTPESLYGSGGAQSGKWNVESGSAEEMSAENTDERGGGLVALLTTFAFDANVQSGVGEDGDAHRGVLRINLNTPWSDELATAIERRFGPDAVTGVKEVFDAGAKFASNGDIVGKLRELGAPPESWGVFVDAFTTCPDPFVLGRVDLSAAPSEVLACVPGLDAEAAEQIVGARERLDAATLADPAWPAAQKIVQPEEFQRAAGHLTTRSLVWRVRVEAGTLPADADESEALRGRMVLDAVLDVTSQRARVAYLRDVTLLPMALSLERGRADSGNPEESGESEGREPGRRSGGASGPSRDSAENLTKEGEETSPPEEEKPRDEAGERPKDGGRPLDAAGTPPERPAPARPEPKDRRRGRWTGGGPG